MAVMQHAYKSWHNSFKRFRTESDFYIYAFTKHLEIKEIEHLPSCFIFLHTYLEKLINLVYIVLN